MCFSSYLFLPTSFMLLLDCFTLSNLRNNFGHCLKCPIFQRQFEQRNAHLPSINYWNLELDKVPEMRYGILNSTVLASCLMVPHQSAPKEKISYCSKCHSPKLFSDYGASVSLFSILKFYFSLSWIWFVNEQIKNTRCTNSCVRKPQSNSKPKADYYM